MRGWQGWIVLAGMLAGCCFWGCGEDESSGADAEIEVQTARFFPTPLNVPVGSTVRWVNVNPRDTLRTVTSGTGPADSTAGQLFDVTLSGYEPGSAEGDDFIYRFEDRGTYYYFSKLPLGSEFTGRIEVQ